MNDSKTRAMEALTASVEKVATEKYKQGFLDGAFVVGAYGIEGARRKLDEDGRNLREIADEARELVMQRGVEWTAR